MKVVRLVVSLSLLLLAANSLPMFGEAALQATAGPTLTATSSQSSFMSNLSPWIGSAIIASIISLLGQLVLFKRQVRKETQSDEIEAFTSAVAPIVEAADDFIARMLDMIVRKKPMQFAQQSLLSSIAGHNISSPPEEITTIFRLARFFAGVAFLQKNLTKYSKVPSVRMADFWAHNKIRMALKGNLPSAPNRLPTETQQYIGSKFLSLTESHRPDDLDYYTFITKIRGDEEAEGSVVAIASFLTVDPDFIKAEPQQIALAFTLVYMIDMYQDLLNVSKWEEFRVFLVSLLKHWKNLSSKRSNFLYAKDDLSSTDYRDTFPLMMPHKESKRRRNKRLSNRQTRGRIISRMGIVRKMGETTTEYVFNKSPGDVFHELESIIWKG